MGCLIFKILSGLGEKVFVSLGHILGILEFFNLGFWHFYLLILCELDLSVYNWAFYIRFNAKFCNIEANPNVFEMVNSVTHFALVRSTRFFSQLKSQKGTHDIV